VHYFDCGTILAFFFKIRTQHLKPQSLLNLYFCYHIFSNLVLPLSQGKDPYYYIKVFRKFMLIPHLKIFNWITSTKSFLSCKIFSWGLVNMIWVLRNGVFCSQHPSIWPPRICIILICKIHLAHPFTPKHFSPLHQLKSTLI
jgi:hypothetical protein